MSRVNEVKILKSIQNINTCSKFGRNLIVFVIYFLLNLNLAAQDNENHKQEGIGKITGTVIDKDDKSPLKAASVLVIDSRNSAHKEETLTDMNGKFVVGEPYGNYSIEIDLDGYNTTIIDGISLSIKSKEENLDTIKISKGNSIVKIVLKAKDEILNNLNNMKTFHVSRSILSNHGSVIDLLKKLPSVTVDIDGNISLGGNQTAVLYVDGKITPPGIVFSMNAYSVDRIEILSDPSARYQTEGQSGIINIILKKNPELGISGTAAVSLGTKDKYNTSLSLNANNKKMKIFGNYNFQSLHTNTTVDFLQQNYMNILTSTNINPFSGNSQAITNLGSLGINYRFTEWQFLNLNSTINSIKSGLNSVTTYNTFDSTGALSYKSIIKVDNPSTYNNFNAILDYWNTFRNSGKSLHLGASVYLLDDDLTLSADTQKIVLNGNSLNSRSIMMNTYNGYNQIYFNLLGDYLHQISDIFNIEAGISSYYYYNDYSSFAQNFDTVSNLWIPGSLTNTELNALYNSAYIINSSSIGSFGLQLGLRAEHSSSKSYFYSDYYNLFPNVSLIQNLSDVNKIQLNYSRKNGLTCSYQTVLSVVRLTSILRVLRFNAYGFEMIASFNFPQWLTFNGDINFSSSSLKSSTGVSKAVNSTFSKLLTTMNLWYGFNLQIAYNNSSRNPFVNGYLDRSQWFDVVFRKDFSGLNLSVSISATDLFNERKSYTYISDIGYIQNTTTKTDSRSFYLTIYYNFTNLLPKSNF